MPEKASWERFAAQQKAGLPISTVPFHAEKAVTSIEPWSRGPSLSSMSDEPQEKAARYLKAYKVGWFHKAGRKITADAASLPWNVSDGDAESGDQEAVLERPDLYVPFGSLSPIDQFQRLMERPNPHQTGRALRQKTYIRVDFGGAGMLALLGGYLPTEIYGISPSRMWPARDKSGELIGWVMDRDRPDGGIPFSKDEIVVVSSATSDDDDWFGVSVVEAVAAQVPLTEMMARHTANVLGTGGRLAGMISPKERSLSEDEYQDAQRAWRNIASDPDAGRRLLLFPEPMEYTAGSSTPAEIGIPELATLTRDEILTAFPLSPYMLGVPTPGGLNSGEVRREDRRDYWQGTIHPRADLLQEVLQTELLSRYEEATGQTFNLKIEEPNLDDAPVLQGKAEAFKALVAIGFDPKEAVKAVELDHIKWNGLPEMLDPKKQAEMAEQAALAARQQPAPEPGEKPVEPPKPAKPTPVQKATKAREDIADKGLKLLTEFLTAQQFRVVAKLRESLPTTKAARLSFTKADPDWWDAVAEDAALQQTLRGLYVEAGRTGLQVVADGLGRAVTNKAVQRIVDDLLAYGGTRIVDINARTRDAISSELAEGARRGYSIPQLIDGVPNEGFNGVLKVGLDNGIGAWDELRAETIARTETALSYNRASLKGYAEFQIRNVQAVDGDQDDECASRNGNVFSVNEALGVTDHPNGTLDWIPIIGEKAHEDSVEIIREMASAFAAMKSEPQVIPPTVVNVSPEGTSAALIAQGDAIRDLADQIGAMKTEPPVVNVPAPIVNLPAPIVTVTSAKAPDVTVNVDNVRVTSMPKRAHRIERDHQGKPTGSVVEDA